MRWQPTSRAEVVHRVQQLLQHSDEAVTMLYAMADALTARRMGKQKGAMEHGND